MPLDVKIKVLFDGAKLPHYATDGAGAMDLSACINRPIKLYPGATEAIPTGLAVELPEGYGLFITPRSGLAIKHNIVVLNTPGLVDADYRGEIRVVLKNTGDEVFYINPEARVAQMFVLPLPHIRWVEVDELSETARAAGGFGHTGL
jgi:dUTP pyrophosphatase